MIPKIGINQRLYMLNVINKLSDFLKWTQFILSCFLISLNSAAELRLYCLSSKR